MSTRIVDLVPLQPGDRAPNLVLDAITREGKIALEDFRGQRPMLIGLFRGLHCPFCRRHIAAQAQLDPRALREKGVESLPWSIRRLSARGSISATTRCPICLRPPTLNALSHRAFGLPNLEFTQERDELAVQGRR